MTDVDTAEGGLAVPLSYLHLQARSREALEKAGFRQVADLLDGDEVSRSAAHLFGEADLGQARDAVSLLAEVRDADGTPDWQAYWARRSITLIPGDDQALSPRELLAAVPKIFEGLVVASEERADMGRRAWNVISHRNGLTGAAYTLEEIGSGLNLTRERIRQIQKRATDQLQETARRGFARSNYRVQPLVARSLEGVLGTAPDDANPVIRESDLIARLGLIGGLSEIEVRRLEFLLALRGIERTEGERAIETMWVHGDAAGWRLRSALPRVRDVLAGALIEGGTDLEIAIAATRSNRKQPIDDSLVAAALPLLDGIERLPDGRTRMGLGGLAGTENQAYRLLSDAGGPLQLGHVLRSINAVRRVDQGSLYKVSLSGQLSADPRFVPFARTGWWGLTGRDDRAAKPMWEKIVDALRRLGAPSEPQAIADAMDPPEANRSLVIIYLHQLRPSHVVQLRDQRWVLATWPEARDRSNVKEPVRRPKVVTKAQAEVDAELIGMLSSAPGGDLSIGAAADGIARTLHREWASAYYYIGRSKVIETTGFGNERRVALRRKPTAEP